MGQPGTMRLFSNFWMAQSGKTGRDILGRIGGAKWGMQKLLEICVLRHCSIFGYIFVIIETIIWVSYFDYRSILKSNSVGTFFFVDQFESRYPISSINLSGSIFRHKIILRVSAIPRSVIKTVIRFFHGF